MIQFLYIFSFLGILQGFILAFIFYAKRKQNEHNKRLAQLFTFFSSILLLITVSNHFSVNTIFLFEFVEFGITFLAGPFLYFAVGGLLDRSSYAKKAYVLHFAPFFIYITYQLLNIGLKELPDIPILIPLIHFQIYTLWMLKLVFQENLFNEIGKERSRGEWIALITLLLIGVHIAQWIRYLYSEVEQLSVLVPAVSFGGFYLLSMYGLSRSQLFVFKRKYKSDRYTKNKDEVYKNELLHLFEKTEIHSDSELTLEQVGLKMGVPPHVVSRLINDLFGVNFNAFVNKYRVASAKRYLKDPANNCYTIEALAEKAGFNSRSSFYSSFRKVTGTTPSAYRDYSCPES